MNTFSFFFRIYRYLAIAFTTQPRQVYGYFDANNSGLTTYSLIPPKERPLCDSQLACFSFRDFFVFRSVNEVLDSITGKSTV
jgi:hypothetical protein